MKEIPERRSVYSIPNRKTVYMCKHQGSDTQTLWTLCVCVCVHYMYIVPGNQHCFSHLSLLVKEKGNSGEFLNVELLYENKMLMKTE